MTKFARIPPSALRHPETDSYVVPQPGAAYDDDDVLVLAHPSAFATAAELEGSPRGDEVVVSVSVEQATAAPGEKRSTRRK